MPLIKQVDDNAWLVEAKIDIEELNECLGLDFPAEEGYESLGGFIFHLIGHIPNEKEEVRYQNHILIVEKVQRHRIHKVRIIKNSNPSEEVSE
jgi:CBS domain containing-hemolysin-like protein